MPDILISVEVDDHDAQEFFTYAGYRSRDMSEPFRAVFDLVVAPGIMEQFENNPPGGLRAGGWAPLKESYLAQKMADGYDHRTLIRRGDLHLAAMRPWHRVTHDGLDVAILDEKAAYHQYGRSGGHSKGGSMPERPIVVWTKTDDEMSEAIFTLWLDQLRTGNRRRGEPSASLRPDVILNTSVAGIDY